MTKEFLEKLEQAVLQIFKNNAPVRTGTLKGQIRLERTENGFKIISDIWYMKYTEEKWTYNSRWKKTLVNKNEGWFKRSMELSMQFLQNVTGRSFDRVS